MKQKLLPSIQGALGQGIFSLLDNGIVAAFGLFYVVALARILPKEQYGLVVLVDSVRNVALLFGVAVGQAMVKHLADDQADHQKVLGSVFFIELAYIVSIGIVLVMMRGSLAALFHMPMLADLLLVLPALILLTTVRNLGRQINVARIRIQRVLIQDVSFLIIFCASILVFHRVVGLINAMQALWLLIAARAAETGLSLVLTWDWLKVERPNRIWISKIWDFAKYTFMNSLAVQGYSRSDVLILGVLLTPVAVATYNAGAVVLNLFMVINESMNTVVFPLSAHICSTGEQDSQVAVLRGTYVRWSVIFTLVSLPVAIGLLLFAPQISHLLYGGKYPELATIFRFFAFWGLVLPISRAAASVLNGMGQPQKNLQFTWIGALLSICLNLFLIPWLGVLGAAITSVAVAFVIACLYWWTMKGKLGVSLGAMLHEFTRVPVLCQMYLKRQNSGGQ